MHILFVHRNRVFCKDVSRFLKIHEKADYSV
jgi:hypothetical protein